MKQILVVLLLTALVTAGYVATRMLTEPATPAAPGPAITPGVGGGDRTPQVPVVSRPTPEPAAPVATGPVAAPVERGVWTEAAAGDLLPALEDHWQVDLSEVDFDADVLVRYEGGELTREEFRAATVLLLASPLAEALTALELARSQARAEGSEPVELDQELLDRRFEYWCEARGLDVEQGAVAMGLQNRMPAAAARRFYDVSGQVSLTSAFNATLGEEWMAAFLSGIPSAGGVAAVEQMVDELQSRWAAVQADAEGAEDAFRETLLILDQLSLMRINSLRADLGRRIWTSLDHALPEGQVVGFTFGELQPGVLPWESPSVGYVAVEEIWSLIADGLSRVQLESALSDLLFVEVVSAALETEGRLESESDAWRQWADEFEAQTNTVIGPRVLYLDLLSFPSLHVYRAVKRLVRSFERTQPADWRSEDDLRAFYDRNRMFIESWVLSTTTALFPAQAPEDPYGPFDWAAAEAAARAFLDEVEAGGDFTTLSAAHSERLGARYLEGRGPGAAAEFSSVFRQGRLSGPLNEVNKVLKLGYYRRLLSGGGSFFAALSEGHDGSVQGPARTPLGHLLVRIDQVSLPGLEREYEDMEYQTKETHRDFAFMAWANERMREAGLPGNGG